MEDIPEHPVHRSTDTKPNDVRFEMVQLWFPVNRVSVVRTVVWIEDQSSESDDVIPTITSPSYTSTTHVSTDS